MEAIELLKTPRLMLAGTGSGSGKTTVTCAVLGALKNRNVSLRSFKCGPDYIDPMFHTKILGVHCRNLDSFLCNEQTVKYLFAKNSPSHCLSLIEGVMGYYDGLGGTELEASSHHIAGLIQAPVVLVMRPKGQSLSLAAELQGFLNFVPNNIRGVILNGIKPSMYPFYKRILEENCKTEVLGYLPYLQEVALESRHLGLVTAEEIIDLREKMHLLAEQAEKTINLQRLLEIAKEAEPVAYQPMPVQRVVSNISIGIAQDAAFCFYYKDSLELLQAMGANLVPFSPLGDSGLPEGIHGLLLGGGYPELHVRHLSYQVNMLDGITAAIGAGMPVIAECGGFMLLCNRLTTLEGATYRMAGAINTSAKMSGRLHKFGYTTLTANQDNLLCKEGESIPAHEFHYSSAMSEGVGFKARKYNGKSWNTAHVSETMYAGYPHLHLWGNPEFARNFLLRCQLYKESTT